MIKGISDNLWQTILALEAAVESRDSYTEKHQLSVSSLSESIGRALELSEDEISCLKVCGMLHDVGKIATPLAILNKPGKLDKEEYEIIKKHPSVGYDILKHIDFPWPVARICEQHHERLDGSGYPHNLKEKDIIFEAKIIAISDVMHSMMFSRPYREGLGLDIALEELEKNQGLYYDKDIVQTCAHLFRETPVKVLPQYYS